MFVVDSPGGEADGTRNLSETIANLGKPTVAFIDGMAASAAYWIASAADKIVAALDTDEIGSIGTYVSFADFRDYYEQQGVKLHEVYATKSTNKNKEFKQALDGKYGPLRAQIDVINESFIAGVKQNRKGKMDEDEEEAFTGKLYFADVAKEKGLIDEIGSFETAIESMNDFINVQKSKNENIMKFSLAGMKESAVAFYKSIFGAETEELTAEQVELIAEKAEASAAEVTRLTTELEAVNAEKAELIANTETVAAKVTSLEAAATEKETEITSLKEKMAEMAGQALPDTKIEKNDEIEASDDILKTEEFATSKFANEMMA
jgi:protease-4